MKFFAIVVSFFVLINSHQRQIAEFEKQALASVQSKPASSFDEGLPKRPFPMWFKEIVGERAGVVWQLSECGEPIGAPDKAGQDVSACAEVNAVLPDDSKVVVMFLVGTFKRGLKGEPAFYGAVIEHKDEFYKVQRLRDLPKMMRRPEGRQMSRAITLPAINAKQALFKLHFQSPPTSSHDFLSEGSSDVGAPLIPPTPPTPPQQPQQVAEGIVQGWALTRVKPVYPANARKMNAYGSVKVRIIISQEGRVIEAAAISGHLVLRSAAVEAARGWIFKPTTIDGVPIKVESFLTFVFARGSQ